MRFPYVVLLAACALMLALPLLAQSPNGVINGLVVDPSNRLIVGGDVVVVNDATGVQYTTKTNEEGIYVLPNLPPGPYRLQVSKVGFKTIIKPDIVIHIQDALAINFTLPVGATSEVVTVQGGGPVVNTESASVGTIVDRQFVENLPLNGRSFNTLLQLTPGVAIVPNNGNEGGQFSVSGQRSNANYFQVDGVSVNFGVGTNEAMVQAGSGAVQAFNAFGGTSSLVSVDAMQEFRVETSSFAPEFGRTPGGQVVISTRSGTNEFHGDLFEYFRNDVLDANDWFAIRAGKPRAPERQNDFGGVFGGRIRRDRTFFFLSYEALRLRQPQTSVIQVPSIALRSSAIPAAAPYLDAYPLPDPNAPVSPDGNSAQFTGNYSNQITMTAASLRLDHTFNGGLSLFGRYNWAPSKNRNRPARSSLSELQTIQVNTNTLTVGMNAQVTANLINSLRLNYSSQKAGTDYALDSFGGATPPDSNLLLPPPFGSQDGIAFFFPLFGVPLYEFGRDSNNHETQWNIVEDLTVVRGLHQFKFGADYRRLLLSMAGLHIAPDYLVLDAGQFAASATPSFIVNDIIHPGKASFGSFSAYAQDSWKISPRLTLTYGLRWELNPAPSAEGGTVLASWQDVDVPANTSLSAAGTPPWKTTYGNFAPRVGAAYRLTQKGDLVLRGGWGMFYDLGTGEASNLLSAFPNSANAFLPGLPLPITNAAAITPSFSAQPPYSGFDIFAFAPNLHLPRSYQWNVAVEKSIWGPQALSLTYVGQVGRRLLRTQQETAPNSNFAPGSLLSISSNGDTSDYDALQVQYRRPMANRFQALLSYTWSHSIDTNSDDSFFSNSVTIVPAQTDRGSSSFDLRHNFTGALTYDVPQLETKSWLTLMTRNWSLATVFQARTGFPVQVVTTSVPIPGSAGNPTRPDVVTGSPIWLHGAQYPGGMALNAAAFTLPSIPRQGTLARNSIYGFGATQFDVSLQRKFGITGRLSLLFRTDAFNILNHPHFSNPDGTFGIDSNGMPAFINSGGMATQMLNQGLGGLNALYQIGGPRSLQVSLKLLF